MVEDFHSLDCIKSHFEVWRRDYADCYRDAYIGLCLPKLFNPLVRLQLITWNPLEVRLVWDLWFELVFFKYEWWILILWCLFFPIPPGTVCKFRVHALVRVPVVLRLWGAQHFAERGWRYQPAACYCGDCHPVQIDWLEKPTQLHWAYQDLLGKICNVYSCMGLCVFVSVGRASVGPAVKQSDSQSGGLHSQTNEGLPHRAAWGKPIHTGINIMNFICKTRDNFSHLSWNWCLDFFLLSGAFKNHCIKDQADSWRRCLPSTLPKKVCFSTLWVVQFAFVWICIIKLGNWLKFCFFFFCLVCWRTRIAVPTYSTRGSSGLVWR